MIATESEQVEEQSVPVSNNRQNYVYFDPEVNNSTSGSRPDFVRGQYGSSNSLRARDSFMESKELWPPIVYKFDFVFSIFNILGALKTVIPEEEVTWSEEPTSGESDCAEFYVGEAGDVRVRLATSDKCLILRAKVFGGMPTTFFKNIRIWVEESILAIYPCSGPSIFLHASPCPIISRPDWFENVCISHGKPIGSLYQVRNSENERKLPVAICKKHRLYLKSDRYCHWFGREPRSQDRSMSPNTQHEKLLNHVAKNIGSKSTLEAVGINLGVSQTNIARHLTDSSNDLRHAASQVLREWSGMDLASEQDKHIHLVDALREAQFDEKVIYDLL